MSGFTKLFGSIIHSTIWREQPHVRLVWITMLAMANKSGVVEASIPGLADAARVSLDECKNALERLESPDEYSRTKEHEGRRIGECDGGWLLLNHAKYRKLQSKDEQRAKTAERTRRWRAKKQDVTPGVTLCDECDAIADPDPDPDPEREGSAPAPAHDVFEEKIQQQADQHVTETSHPIVALMLETWPDWNEMDASDSLLRLKRAHQKFTDNEWRRIIKGTWSEMDNHTPVSKYHKFLCVSADKAARAWGGAAQTTDSTGRPHVSATSCRACQQPSGDLTEGLCPGCYEQRGDSSRPPVMGTAEYEEWIKRRGTP